MNTTPPQRPLDRYFAGYAEYYRHPLNQAIGGVAVPAMAWSAVALLWCIPVFGTLAKTGIWAVFFVFGCLCRLFEMRLGLAALLWTAAAVFAIGGIAQFVGYRIEGRRPAFLGDLRYLLVGPLWVLARVYRRMGWKY